MIQAPNDDQDDEKKLPGEINTSETPDLKSRVSEPEEELILPPDEPSQQEAALLIRDAAGQLKDFLGDRRRESEEFARRMTRLEEEIQNNGNSSRHLMTLSVVVALIAFAATTGLWRLARNQSEVKTALQQTMSEVKASREANLKRISEVQGAVAAGVEVQAATALRLERELSGQLDDQKKSTTRLEQRLGEATENVAEVRKDVAEKLAIQSELTKVDRARMIGEIKTAIGVLEASLEERSNDFAEQSKVLKSQQKEFSEATARARADRQAMVRAATQTVNAQLLGLQEMLDTLEGGQRSKPESISTTNAEAKGKKTAKTRRPTTVIAAVPPKKKTDGKAAGKPPATKESVEEATPATMKKGEASKSSIESDGDSRGQVEDTTSAATTEKEAPAKASSAPDLSEKPAEKLAEKPATQSVGKKLPASDDSKER
jgi:hypothetical protein